MKKLIKLSDNHYIVVDDSEIKEGEWYLTFMNNEIVGEPRRCEDSSYSFGNCKKITHSTQPLESSISSDSHDAKGFVFIEPILLSDVEEAIKGYSVEDIADSKVNEVLLKEGKYWNDQDAREPVYYGVIAGINAHQELVKDKLFTVEDIVHAYELGIEDSENVRLFGKSDVITRFRNIIQKSLLPKTEWDVEFVNGKIKLA
jgi:hypothetical protein